MDGLITQVGKIGRVPGRSVVLQYNLMYRSSNGLFRRRISWFLPEPLQSLNIFHTVVNTQRSPAGGPHPHGSHSMLGTMETRAHRNISTVQKLRNIMAMYFLKIEGKHPQTLIQIILAVKLESRQIPEQPKDMSG